MLEIPKGSLLAFNIYETLPFHKRLFIVEKGSFDY